MINSVWIETRFGKVFGQSAGKPGQTVLLGLHGWSPRNGWQTWEPFLIPLAQAGFWVVSVDMPGWGQSVSTVSHPLNTNEAVTAVTDILAGLHAETAVLMGKSWGGGVAIHTALAHPTLVSHLILTAPAFHELDRLSDLRPPVLLTWAEDDPMIPIEHGQTIAAVVPQIKFVSYPNGRHAAAAHNAADFTPKIISFLQEQHIKDNQLLEEKPS